MKGEMAIGEAAERAGVSTSAIRYYERVGLLPEPERTNGRRRYGEQVLRRLALVRGAKRAGFTLGEIRTLLHGFPTGTAASDRWRTLAREKLVEVDVALAQLWETKELLGKALRCECASLDECATLLDDA